MSAEFFPETATTAQQKEHQARRASLRREALDHAVRQTGDTPLIDPAAVVERAEIYFTFLDGEYQTS